MDRPQTAPTLSTAPEGDFVTREELAAIHERRLDKLVDELITKDAALKALEAQLRKAEDKLQDSERLRRWSMQAEHKCRLALSASQEDKRTAEVCR